MRKTTAIIAAMGILASLTACASGGPYGNGCIPAFKSGDASSVVKAAEAKDSIDTDVSFPTPLHAKPSEASFIKEGKGAPAVKGSPLLVLGQTLNGTTGVGIQTIGGSLVTVGDSELPVAISKGTECATKGAQIAIVGSPKDSHDGAAIEDAGVGADDSLVYVLDIATVFLAKANGAEQIPQSGMPTVVTAPNGAPGITIPKISAPKKRTVEVLKAGSGQKLKADDFAVVKYTGVSWPAKPNATGKATVFDSSWDPERAVVWQIGSESVSAGLTKSLTGQRVGSQLVIVLPKEDAVVPDGSVFLPEDTLVYVVDILGIATT